MCGRLRVGKNFLHVCSIGRVRSRVRPVDAPVVTSSNRDLRIHPKIIPLPQSIHPPPLHTSNPAFEIAGVSSRMQIDRRRTIRGFGGQALGVRPSSTVPKTCLLYTYV